MKEVTDYQFYKRLTQLPFIEEIWLFGSRSRGDYQEKSDFDLAIICPRANQDEWRQVQEIIQDADTLLKIDCMNFHELALNSVFRANILKDRKILFHREKPVQEKLKIQLGYLEQALLRLEEMISEPVDEKRAQIDSSIQRFEFCIELFWKTLRLVLESRGRKASFPKDILRVSYQNALIEDEATWLAMLNDRNETSHVYDQQMADRIYTDIKNTYFPLLQATYRKLLEAGVDTESEDIARSRNP